MAGKGAIAERWEDFDQRTISAGEDPFGRSSPDFLHLAETIKMEKKRLSDARFYLAPGYRKKERDLQFFDDADNPPDKGAVISTQKPSPFPLHLQKNPKKTTPPPPKLTENKERRVYFNSSSKEKKNYSGKPPAVAEKTAHSTLKIVLKKITIAELQSKLAKEEAKADVPPKKLVKKKTPTNPETTSKLVDKKKQTKKSSPKKVPLIREVKKEPKIPKEEAATVSPSKNLKIKLEKIEKADKKLMEQVSLPENVPCFVTPTTNEVAKSTDVASSCPQEEKVPDTEENVSPAKITTDDAPNAEMEGEVAVDPPIPEFTVMFDPNNFAVHTVEETISCDNLVDFKSNSYPQENVAVVDLTGLSQEKCQIGYVITDVLVVQAEEKTDMELKTNSPQEENKSVGDLGPEEKDSATADVITDTRVEKFKIPKKTQEVQNKIKKEMEEIKTFSSSPLDAKNLGLETKEKTPRSRRWRSKSRHDKKKSPETPKVEAKSSYSETSRYRKSSKISLVRPLNKREDEVVSSTSSTSKPCKEVVPVTNRDLLDDIPLPAQGGWEEKYDNNTLEDPYAQQQRSYTRRFLEESVGVGVGSKGEKIVLDPMVMHEYGLMFYRGQQTPQQNILHQHQQLSQKAPNCLITMREGDVFQSTCALAHCVSADLRMSSGVAVMFRRKFGHVAELLNQRRRPGQVAFQHHGGRFIYYLVTKDFYLGKPDGVSVLSDSLWAMRLHCVENGVTQLAMPKIGCGRDHLQWENVEHAIRCAFNDTGIQIFVYHIKEEPVSWHRKRPHNGFFVGTPPAAAKRSKTDWSPAPQEQMPYKPLVVLHSFNQTIVDVRPPALRILLTSVCSNKLEGAAIRLNERFKFWPELMQRDRLLGTCLPLFNGNVFALICKEEGDSPIDFVALHKAAKDMAQTTAVMNNAYRLVLEGFFEPDDRIIAYKVVTILRLAFVNQHMTLFVTWPEEPPYANLVRISQQGLNQQTPLTPTMAPDEYDY